MAAELELPPSTVYGVVTFYDLFHQKPVGRHRIRVCTNLSCQLRGAEEIMEALAEELGVGEDEVTPDGRCSYVHFECLGSCDTAPMMMVDDDYHENLTPQRVRQIVREARLMAFERVLTQERRQARGPDPRAATARAAATRALAKALGWSPTRSSRRSRTRACAAAAAPASPPG